MKQKKNSRFRKRAKDEKGQAVVEFAIVLPIFLLVLFGILDFGWLFYNQISVENAARNAARIACVDYQTIAVNDDGTINTAATVAVDIAKAVDDDERDETQQLAIDMSSALEGTLTDAVMTVSYSTDTNAEVYPDPTVITREKGDVTVKVSCKMRVLTPVLGVFSDGMTRTLTSTSTFKVEKGESTTATTTE